jgi:hypothetical protein
MLNNNLSLEIGIRRFMQDASRVIVGTASEVPETKSGMKSNGLQPMLRGVGTL